MPHMLLNDMQGRPFALQFVCVRVSAAMRVHALLDPDLDREPLHQVPHVDTLHRLALERTEQRMPAFVPERIKGKDKRRQEPMG